MSGAAGTIPLILVVDDDRDIRLLVSRLLASQGYEVAEAAGADEAERIALRRRPSLILMDVGMPDRDGLSALWGMRGRPELSGVPCVVLTAYDSYDLRAEAAGAGCRAYLTKPIDFEELLATVVEVLRDRAP